MNEPGEDWCRFHLNRWSVKRRHYEYQRLANECVYCGNELPPENRGHLVCCNDPECLDMHKVLVDTAVALRAGFGLNEQTDRIYRCNCKRIGVPWPIYAAKMYGDDYVDTPERYRPQKRCPNCGATL